MKCLTGQRSNAHPLIKEKAKKYHFPGKYFSRYFDCDDRTFTENVLEIDEIPVVFLS